MRVTALAILLMSAAGSAGAAPAAGALKCPPADRVWVNTRSGIYHNPGSPWYAKTAHGKYECRADADRDGHTPSRTGD